MVAAAQPEAVEAGVGALHAGGNAVDAAIACALVAGVVDPQMCGIAGFGNAQLYLPGAGVHTCVDFHGTSPAATRPDMWEHLIVGETRDGFGFLVEGNVNDVGYQSITTPGSLLAYYEAQTRYGTLPWADVVAPAIRWAEEGFAIRPATYHWWQEGATMGRVDAVERLGHTPAGRRIYFHPDGTLHSIGETLRNPDMAESLRRIAAGGADVFYRGDMAEQIAADMAANGGLLSSDDLANYSTVWGEPLRTTYRGLDVATNQPPGGGIMVVEMLNTLQHFDLAAMGHNSVEYVRTVSEVMKRTTADKDAYVGDPAFVDVPIDRLLSADYGASLADQVRRGQRAEVARMQGEPPDTTHVCAVDGDGNAVTMTHSLGMPSGVITDGLGFMYNGCMGVFDPRPGRAGSLAAGKRRFSSLCPTMVFRDGEIELVVGAPGGTQIAMGVTQVLLNSIDFAMPMLDAIIAPRFSSTSNAIDVCNRIPRSVSDTLAADGYEVIRWPQSYAFALVHGIAATSSGLVGAADPGGDGMALAA
ncbi:MAG: gamma-glutamyltransferase [Actinomycetia bacterium]|nr:gamma-glutamyltransferase [Actinomycetes bacterium]MCP5035022.1 gamma-glutamyltransferase [Actinomycetes bacterium]